MENGGQLAFFGDGIVDALDVKMQTAAERLRAFEPPEGYYLAFSGGKDSIAAEFMCRFAGVKYDAHYAVTTVDPPELTRFIKKNYPQVEMHIPEINMWELIIKKRMPPTRMVRYCCDKLKEEGGQGRTVVTGVRWAESSNRKNTRNDVEYDVYGSEAKKAKEDRKQFYLLNDNDSKRRMMEHCPTGRGKHVVNPLIDWTDEHVWLLIKRYNLPYPKLYDEGFKRLGCIACPMNGSKGIARHFIQWPYAFKQYLIAFHTMLEGRYADGLDTDDTQNWKTGHDVMMWWMDKSLSDYTILLEEIKISMIKNAKPHWIKYTKLDCFPECKE